MAGKSPKMNSPRKAKSSLPHLPLNDIFPQLRERVEKLMQMRKFTWTEISRKTRVSRPTLYRMIQGDGNPYLSNLIRLADCLGTSLTYLLGPQQSSQDKIPKRATTFDALVADPIPPDLRPMAIYEMVCRGRPLEEILERVDELHYKLPSEKSETAINRAVLDVFYNRLAWIDHERLPRVQDLEKRIQKTFNLLPCRQIAGDDCPVRVLNLDSRLHPQILIHALAAATAAVIRNLGFKKLGFADGYTISTVLRFLRRNDLTGCDLVPLTYAPGFANFELSGPTLIGALARTHHGYGNKCTIEIARLRDAIAGLELAVMSCGSVLYPEPNGRLGRLMREAKGSQVAYENLVARMRKQGAVGDLVYHFLDAEGKIIPATRRRRELEDLDSRQLTQEISDSEAPPIYSISPRGLARIAERGFCILVARSKFRAEIARAALLCPKRPINFLVTTRTAALKILKP